MGWAFSTVQVEIILSKQIPPFHLGDVICLTFSALNEVELGVELREIPSIIPP